MSKQLVREYIKEQNFKGTDNILVGLKDMFKDILQETLGVEVDKSLGYIKFDNGEKETLNRRNESKDIKMNSISYLWKYHSL